MANQENDKNKSKPGPESGRHEPGSRLESGTYEIIKNRLLSQGNQLKERLEKLNTARKEVFGSIENTLMGSERIITRNNCIPRDMVTVGDKFIFGYNVHVGLKASLEPGDVFAVYQYKDRNFSESNLDLIDDKRFLNEFHELYKYYKNTLLTRLVILGPYLYMVFRVGKDVTDIKAFKWLIEDGNTLAYVDNRSDHEVTFPSSHDFEWKQTRRESHRYGAHPHVSIQDRVFVETVGGDLTIKVEDNTESGQGIYAEEVEDKDQTLDDGEIYFACVGNLILLKMRPYREKDSR
ncbi:MAG: AAA family ATPase, partial [bacterium]|nr:AAA family ATPase [bacterium]